MSFNAFAVFFAIAVTLTALAANVFAALLGIAPAFVEICLAGLTG
jgi:hypothetical protein